MLYKFEQVHNMAETTKNICSTNSEWAVDHRKQMFEEILLRLQEPQQSGKVR